MLLRFRVSNYRSIDELQEISMVAGDVRHSYHHIQRTGNIKTLKFSALFGANAGGKTTVVKAIACMKESAVGRTLPPDSIGDWCRISPENRDKPSTFEADIRIGNTVYSYGFAAVLAENRVVGEWCYKHEIGSTADEEEVFVRNLNPENQTETERQNRSGNHPANEFPVTGINTIQYMNEMEPAFHTIKKQFEKENENNKNRLIISLFSPFTGIPEKEIPCLRKVAEWFANTLQIIRPLPIGIQYQNQTGYPADTAAREIASAQNRKVKLNDIAELALRLGLGIRGVTVTPLTEDDLRNIFTEQQVYEYKKYFPKLRNASGMEYQTPIREFPETGKPADTPDKPYGLTGILIPLENALIFCPDDAAEPYPLKIGFRHGTGNTAPGYEAESDGTKRVMELLEIICSAKYGGKRTYILDDIDRNIHPKLTYRLIEEFLNAASDSDCETQLFITTREPHILDMKLVRQDEIWITDTTPAGSSFIYSLSDFKHEHIIDKDVVSRYLDGRYGGIPVFDTMFPAKNPG